MSDRQRGFSLLEVMLVLAIFLIVSGAVFELLNTSQIRYRAEREFLESFQGARLGVELMVRDIHNAGYPPPYTFAGNLAMQPVGPTPLTYPLPIPWTDPSAANANLQRRFAMGILGIAANGSVSTTCTVNGGTTPCAIPNAWDLVVELDIDPENPNPDPVTGLVPQVEWVRYNLLRPGEATTSTLFRSVSAKVAGISPTAAARQSNVPFVEEVVQNPNVAVGATNPAVFTYECDPTTANPPGSNICRAEHVKHVYIALQVQSTRADIQTQQLRRMTIRGAASRQYPTRP